MWMGSYAIRNYTVCKLHESNVIREFDLTFSLPRNYIIRFGLAINKLHSRHNLIIGTGIGLPLIHKLKSGLTRQVTPALEYPSFRSASPLYALYSFNREYSTSFATVEYSQFPFCSVLLNLQIPVSGITSLSERQRNKL
jgi:hypothetical protein